MSIISSVFSRIWKTFFSFSVLMKCLAMSFRIAALGSMVLYTRCPKPVTFCLFASSASM